jgi:hypothetical protein
MTMVFPGGSDLSQQDKAPFHTAPIVQEWFEEHDEEFKVLRWPQMLNSIEHLWDQNVRFTEAISRNLQDMKDLLLTSWCQKPQNTFRGLVESMPRLVGSFLVACGGPTAYVLV